MARKKPTSRYLSSFATYKDASVRDDLTADLSGSYSCKNQQKPVSAPPRA
jgi:hypothetical protein